MMNVNESTLEGQGPGIVYTINIGEEEWNIVTHFSYNPRLSAL